MCVCVYCMYNIIYLLSILFCVFQSYTASVLEGSNPTFKWTVDDKPFFTYYNTVLNVIYQHAAVYKLTVGLLAKTLLPFHHYISPYHHKLFCYLSLDLDG